MKHKKQINNYEQAKMPSRLEAVRIASGYLQERIHNGSNPRIIYEHGAHVFNVAKIAEAIAKKSHGIIDVNKAYILGLLHDVGRVKDETVTKIPHSIEGFKYLRDMGYEEIAPVCVTHNFINKDIKREDYPTYSDDLFDKTKNFLKSFEYNDYDRLIQLSDLFSRGKEIMSIQQRLDKNKQFYHIEKLSYEGKAFELRDYFDNKFNIDVEQIVADTFDMKKHTDEKAVIWLIPQITAPIKKQNFAIGY